MSAVNDRDNEKAADEYFAAFEAPANISGGGQTPWV